MGVTLRSLWATELLDIDSVNSLKDQINKQQETLLLPEEVNKVLGRILEDLTDRLSDGVQVVPNLQSKA